MEGTITHRTVEVNGISLHVAQSGSETAPVVLFLHGFPELWYSWRHQMLYLAARGYRAVAPDLRGFGDSSVPASVSEYTVFHVVGDLVALIRSLRQNRVFVVGHDWGANIAWHLCLIRPDLVKALVNMSVEFHTRHPTKRPVDAIRDMFGDHHYICRFQEPGVAETEFSHVPTKVLLNKFYAYRKPEALVLPKEKGLGGSPDTVLPLPPWLAEKDLDYFTSKFKKTGFTGGLNYYRCMNLNWELTAPWTGVQIKVPVKFMVGGLDLTYHTPGVKKYIHEGGFKAAVPYLQEVVVMEGVGHFINQEKPDEVSWHICNFFQKIESPEGSRHAQNSSL